MVLGFWVWFGFFSLWTRVNGIAEVGELDMDCLEKSRGKVQVKKGTGEVETW